MSERDRWLRSVLPVALFYAVVGVATANLAGSAQSTQSRTLWRLAAWVLSLIAFAGHVVHERRRVGNSAKKAALHAAVAVALAAFALAAVGPVRTHWAANDFWRTAVLSLALWPILTGIPAFLVALVAGSILGRVVIHRERQ